MAAAISAGTKSDAIRSISGWVSGSPRRTLNSSTFGTGVGHHQAGVQEAGESGGFHGGMDDAVEDILRLFGGQDGGIAIRAHAAGVRSGVAIEDGFVVLRGREGDDIAAVAQRDEADFFAAQKLLHHQAAGQGGERGFRFGAIMDDHHALARREAVGFQHHGKAEAIDGAPGFGGVPDGDMVGRRDINLRKKVLCEYLAAFELRRRAIRPDDLLCRARGTRRPLRRRAGASGPTTVKSAAISSASAR